MELAFSVPGNSAVRLSLDDYASMFALRKLQDEPAIFAATVFSEHGVSEVQRTHFRVCPNCNSHRLRRKGKQFFCRSNDRRSVDHRTPIEPVSNLVFDGGRPVRFTAAEDLLRSIEAPATTLGPKTSAHAVLRVAGRTIDLSDSPHAQGVDDMVMNFNARTTAISLTLGSKRVRFHIVAIPTCPCCGSRAQRNHDGEYFCFQNGALCWFGRPVWRNSHVTSNGIAIDYSTSLDLLAQFGEAVLAIRGSGHGV